MLVVEDHPGGRAAATSAGGRAGDDPRRAHGRRGAGARGAACRSAAAAGPALVGAAAVVPQARTSPCAAGAETAERLRTPFRQRLDGDGRRAQVLQLLHKVVRALSHSSRPRGPSPTSRVTNSSRTSHAKRRCRCVQRPRSVARAAVARVRMLCRCRRVATSRACSQSPCCAHCAAPRRGTRCAARQHSCVERSTSALPRALCGVLRHSAAQRRGSHSLRRAASLASERENESVK